MCGIAGILEFGPDAHVEASALRRMCDIMFHRGPDDEGFFVRGPVGLGMRRLSIVDLSTGHQPICNEDGTLWLVFNGEIYNHSSLRKQLIARGHRYQTHSDTETILHLYEEYGKECIHHLRGMFAFALWNLRSNSLFLARDRLGIKPLYYRLGPRNLVFGSEIKVLLEYSGATPEFNRRILPEFLAFGYLSNSDTFYSGIQKLMPGHTVEIRQDGTATHERYWDLATPPQVEMNDEHYHVDAYRGLLEESVRSHLMSDVPLGVFLSGGLDSSAVAAITTRITGEPIDTFSVGYTDEAYSELPFARTVAEHLGARHHEVLVSSDDFFGALPKLIWHEDEPIVWPSSVALFFVAQLARRNVKVVLTGEGSDETMAGYSRYAFTLKNLAFDRLYRNTVPHWVRRCVRDFIADSSWIGSNMRRKLSHTFLARDSASWSSFYFDNFYSAFSEQFQAHLFTDEFRKQTEAVSAYRNVLGYWDSSSEYLLQRLLYTDIKTYLVELLMKQDNMSMAASVESRVPFLDHVLVEWTMGIPARAQIHGSSGKRILKQAMQGLLPNSIIDRKKLGFPTPWSSWLNGARFEGVERTLLEPRTLQRGFFKEEAIKTMLREHRAHYRDHNDRIWRLLNLELWHRVCLEGESHELPSEHFEINSITAA